MDSAGCESAKPRANPVAPRTMLTYPVFLNKGARRTPRDSSAAFESRCASSLLFTFSILRLAASIRSFVVRLLSSCKWLSLKFRTFSSVNSISSGFSFFLGTCHHFLLNIPILNESTGIIKETDLGGTQGETGDALEKVHRLMEGDSEMSS
jgi:hypothetical protein